MTRIKNQVGPPQGNTLPQTPPKTPPSGSERTDTSSADSTEDRGRAATKPSPPAALGAVQVPAPRSLSPARPALELGVPHLGQDYVKNRYPAQQYLHLVGFEVVHLLDSDARTTRLYSTKTQEHGGYGKFKCAMTAKGKLVSVKEMRMVPSRKPEALSRFERPKTRAMTFEAVRAEAARTASCRRAIETYMARWTEAHGGSDPLGNIRGRCTPFEVFETIQIGPKVNLVTSVEAGDIFSLKLNVPIVDRGNVALSIAAQVFAELAALHDANVVHLDIKIENLFYSGNGQVKVADFGLSQDAVGGVCAARVQGPVGSIFAPEMILPVTKGSGKNAVVEFAPLTAAADVWAAAVSVLSMLERQLPCRNPFEEIHTSTGHIHFPATAQLQRSFEQTRQQVIDPDGRLRRDVLAQPNGNSQYLAHVSCLKPDLVATLLRYALNRNPQERASAAFIAQELQAQVASLSSREASGVRNFFAKSPGVAEKRGIHEGLHRYKEWDEQAHQGYFQGALQMIR